MFNILRLAEGEIMEKKPYEFQYPRLSDENPDDLEQKVSETEKSDGKKGDNNYQPSLTTIAYEMMKRGSKATVNGLKSIGAGVRVFTLFNLMPYAIPTTIRRSYSPESIWNTVPFSGGPAIVAAGFFGQIMFYGYNLVSVAHQAGHMSGGRDEQISPVSLGLLALPVATNAASLLYEAGRGVYKKGAQIKQELIEEHKRKSGKDTQKL